MLIDFCRLYNAALEHRINAYAKGARITCYDQILTLPEIRRDMPDTHGRWSATTQQQVLRRLDKTYRAFFRRVRRGAKPGFPRFKSIKRFHAADLRVGNGITLRKSGKLGFTGIAGEVKIRWHRPLPSVPKTAVLTRHLGKWYVIFAVEAPSVQSNSSASIGLDLGLTHIATLSTGECVPRPSYAMAGEKRMRRIKRAIARCKRTSSRRKTRIISMARFSRKLANRRRDFQHKLARDLVSRFGRIALEDLSIKGLARGMLAKQVYDAAWAQIIEMIEYKAASAGVEVIKVDPRGTSQTCPECMAVAVKPLDMRQHICECGCVMDRDVAAAMVIHFRALGFWPGAGQSQLSQRVAA